MACGSLLSEEDLCRFRTKKCRRLVSGACEFGITRCQYSHNQYWSRRCPIYLSDRSFIRYIHVLCPHVTTKQADPSDRPTHAGPGCGRPRCVRRLGGGGAPAQQNQHSKSNNGRRRGGSGSGKGSDACCCVDEWREEVIVNTCPRGGECPFAHSTEEILYHPLFYKMIICEKYREDVCDTYYCPYIHGLAEARQPKHYKLPFTTGIDIPPLPCVTIVAKIEKKKNQILTPALGDTAITAVGLDEAICTESPESVLRQAVAAAQRQHRQLQQRSFQICRSLMDASEEEKLAASRSSDQRAHSHSSLGPGSQHVLRTRANGCGDLRSSEDEDSFACQALFDALRSLEGEDKGSRPLSMPSGGRRSRPRESGLEAVAARLAAPQQASLSGSIWPSLPAPPSSQREETAFSRPDRQVEELSTRNVGPRLMFGGIAPGAAAALASRMSPVQLLTAAFELCGHSNRKDTIEFALHTLDDAQEEDGALSRVGFREKLTEVRSAEAEGEASRRQGNGDMEHTQGTEPRSGAAGGQMRSSQHLVQFASQSAACEPDLPAETCGGPPGDQPAPASEGRRNDRTVTSAAGTSSGSRGESGQAPGITFVSLESSTASSPLSSPSSASRGLGPVDLAAFTAQSNANGEQPCGLSSTTRSPSESGAEPEVSSSSGGSFHSTLGASDASTVAVTRAEVAQDRPSEEGARDTQSGNTSDEAQKTEGRQRVGGNEQEDADPMPTARMSRTTECSHPASGITRLSSTCTDCGEVGGVEKRQAGPAEGNAPEATALRRDEPHIKELVRPDHETTSEEHSVHDDRCTAPHILIDRLEQIVKALWENVWKHSPKQWSRIQCASRELASLLELRSLEPLATAGVTEDQWSDLMSLMCALEESSGPVPGGLFSASTGSSPTSSSSEIACNWVSTLPCTDRGGSSFSTTDLPEQSGKAANHRLGPRLARGSTDTLPAHALLPWS